MPNRYEVRLAAVGGQGLITAGALLAKGVIEKKGMYATQSPTYTSQVRGGPTKVDILMDKEEILFPQATAIDLYFATAQKSFDLYYHHIKSDAVIIVDSDLVTKRPPGMPQKLYGIPLTKETVAHVGNIVTVSVVALGIVAKVSKLLSKEELQNIVVSSFPKSAEELNLKAIDLGYSLIS